MHTHISLDFLYQLFDTFESSPSNGTLGDQVVPDFDLIKPRGICWSVMNVPAWMGRQPSFNFRMLVCGVIINDSVYIKLFGNIFIDMLEKVQIFLMTVSAFTFSDYLPAGDVEGSKKRCGAMTFIVVSNAFDVAEAHREHWLSPIECLDLSFFIHTENHCLVWGMRVGSNNTTHLFHEKRIGRELKMTLPMRLKPEGVPDTADGLERDTLCTFSKRPNRPLGALFGLGIESLPNDECYFLVTDAAWPPRAQFIVQSLNTKFQISRSPLPDRRSAQLESFGNRSIGHAINGHKNNASS